MARSGVFRFELSETDDRGDLQRGRGLGYAGEELSGQHIVHQHGLASHAPRGSHGVGLAGSGERPNVAILGLEHPEHRPRDLKVGNTTLYDAKGNATRMLGDDGIWHDAGDRAQRMSGKTLDLAANEQASFGGKKVTYLGGNGKDGVYAPVMTSQGPSRSVFAKL